MIQPPELLTVEHVLGGLRSTVIVKVVDLERALFQVAARDYDLDDDSGRREKRRWVEQAAVQRHAAITARTKRRLGAACSH